MNSIHEWAAGAAFASLIGVSACGHGSPAPRSAAVGDSPTDSGLTDARAGMDTARREAHGTSSPTAAAAGRPTAPMDANTNCESESVDPRFSCHQYRPAILARR